MKTYKNIRKITIGQGHNDTTGFLDYTYLENYYNMIPIDLSKEQELDVDPKANQEINFTGKLDEAGDTTMIFIIEEAKKIFWIFYKELREYCKFIFL